MNKHADIGTGYGSGAVVQRIQQANERRVLVLGGLGAGKTTLARKLAAATCLPLIELDHWRYNADGTRADRDALTARAQALAARPSWICEGMFLTFTQPLLQAADLIIWVDTPAPLAAWRVLRRWAAWRRDGTAPYGPGKALRLVRATLRPHQLEAIHASTKNLAPSREALTQTLAPHRDRVIRVHGR